MFKKDTNMETQYISFIRYIAIQVDMRVYISVI